MRFKAELNKQLKAIVVPLDKVKLKSKSKERALNKILEDGNIALAVQYLQTYAGKASFVPPNFIRIRRGTDDRLSLKEPNSIRAMFVDMLKSNKTHVPYNVSQDFFGVEIECFIPYGAVKNSSERYYFESGSATVECSNCDGSGTVYYDDEDGNECSDECGNCGGSGRIEDEDEDCDKPCREELRRLFKDERIKYCQIKTDGSIEPASGFWPVEITCLSRFSNPSNLKALCSLLNKIGARVNKSCGMHVHLDCRHLTKSDVRGHIARRFENALPAMLSLVPESRRTNSYCKPEVSYENRYSAVNLTAYSDYKTIEIRLHSSTTNFDKILAWSTLCSRIMNTETYGVASTLEALSRQVWLEPALKQYFEERCLLFSSKDSIVQRLIAENANLKQTALSAIDADAV